MLAGAKGYTNDLSCTSNLHAFDGRRDFQIEYRLRRADGEYRWVLTAGSHFAPGAFAGYIGSAIDITDLKRIQEEALSSRSLRPSFLLRVAPHDCATWWAPILPVELAVISLSTCYQLKRSIDPAGCNPRIN